MTDAERKKREREKKRAAGLVPLEVWVPSDRADELRKIVGKMVADSTADRNSTGDEQ